MKTITKVTFASLAITFIFLLSSFITQHQQTTNKFLTLRTIETVGQVFGSRIIIIYEDGLIEEIKLGALKESNLSSNTKVINDVLNKISNKGYDLFTASGGEFGMTYTFLKK